MKPFDEQEFGQTCAAGGNNHITEGGCLLEAGPRAADGPARVHADGWRTNPRFCIWSMETSQKHRGLQFFSIHTHPEFKPNIPNVRQPWFTEGHPKCQATLVYRGICKRAWGFKLIDGRLDKHPVG